MTEPSKEHRRGWDFAHPIALTCFAAGTLVAALLHEISPTDDGALFMLMILSVGFGLGGAWFARPGGERGRRGWATRSAQGALLLVMALCAAKVAGVVDVTFQELADGGAAALETVGCEGGRSDRFGPGI